MTLTYNDCYDALEEHRYNLENTFDAIVDGRFKPWKRVNGKEYGSHEQHKKGRVVLQFRPDEVVPDKADDFITEPESKDETPKNAKP